MLNYCYDNKEPKLELTFLILTLVFTSPLFMFPVSLTLSPNFRFNSLASSINFSDNALASLAFSSTEVVSDLD